MRGTPHPAQGGCRHHAPALAGCRLRPRTHLHYQFMHMQRWGVQYMHRGTHHTFLATDHMHSPPSMHMAAHTVELYKAALQMALKAVPGASYPPDDELLQKYLARTVGRPVGLAIMKVGQWGSAAKQYLPSTPMSAMSRRYTSGRAQ
jgi:hypothetical protein